MIEESYVSFETAKLLKEAGFDELCDWAYYAAGNVCYKDNRNSELSNGYVSCPTQAVASRWLREKQKIDVIVEIYNRNYYDYMIYKNKHLLINSEVTAYETYEDLVNDESLNEFLEVYSSIVNNYYEDVDTSAMIDSAVDGMLDYLGEDYPRLVIDLARQYGSADMKLYINESDLTSDVEKLNSLIHWINQWESDGKTRIDGIGMSMHLSFMTDDSAQRKQEENIKNAFTQLAATGKLIRISELDMNMVDASGAEISIQNMTFEQERLMADFYAFILSTYGELVPADQQGGITQWTIVSSANVPNGLWSEDYRRQPAYAGFVEGLQTILGF